LPTLTILLGLGLVGFEKFQEWIGDLRTVANREIGSASGSEIRSKWVPSSDYIKDIVNIYYILILYYITPRYSPQTSLR
jgi:hypothetical protein